MAGKGGGSWKVAYADFVTAMMAFFLVMWICAQDQKIRQSVAEYFIDPTGAARKPGRTGAVFDTPTTGSVPKSESVALGRGRHSHTPQRDNSPPTKMIGDWLHADEKTSKYWRKQAQAAREMAPLSRDVRDNLCTAEEAAVIHLSRQMREEITRGIPPQAEGIYQDLIFGALAEVNWSELAKDMLSR